MIAAGIIFSAGIVFVAFAIARTAAWAISADLRNEWHWINWGYTAMWMVAGIGYIAVGIYLRQ